MTDLFTNKVFPSNKKSDYFYALIVKEENISWVARKITSLPGVKRTERISEEKISLQLKSILSEIGDGFDIDLQYEGMKVFYATGVEERSKKLIREYLIRLAGREKVTLGPIKEAENKNEDTNLWLKKNVGYSLIVFSAFIWLLSFLSIRKYFFEQTYLISRFQQRKLVLLKTILTGFCSLILVSVVTQVFIGPVHIGGTIGVSIFMIVSGILGGRRERWDG